MEATKLLGLRACVVCCIRPGLHLASPGLHRVALQAMHDNNIALRFPKSIVDFGEPFFPNLIRKYTRSRSGPGCILRRRHSTPTGQSMLQSAVRDGHNKSLEPHISFEKKAQGLMEIAKIILRHRACYSRPSCLSFVRMWI